MGPLSLEKRVLCLEVHLWDIPGLGQEAGSPERRAAKSWQFRRAEGDQRRSREGTSLEDGLG